VCLENLQQCLKDIQHSLNGLWVLRLTAHRLFPLQISASDYTPGKSFRKSYKDFEYTVMVAIITQTYGMSAPSAGTDS